MSTTGQKLSEFVKLLDDTGQNVVPTVGTLGELPAAADNNGLTYYVDSVGRFKSDGVDWNPVDRPLTLEMFDATGDNSTDNASAIAAAEASDETDIWLNDGVYYTTSSSFTKNYIGPGEIRTSGGLHIIGNDRRKLTKWREKSRAIQETTIAAASGTVDAYYTAWPFGCKFITSDGGNDYVNQVYTAGKGHTNGGGGGTFNNKIVLFRRAQIGNESDPIVYGGTTIIADKTASNLDCFTHGACQASNGDLLTIVQTVNTSGSTTATQVYRSTDNGSTWAADNAQWLKSDGVTPLGNPSEAGDMFVTSSGRILTWFRRGDNGESIVQYSDDHGATWVDNVANTIGNTGRGVGEYEALEGKFTETTDGTIVAIVRQSADSVYSAREAAMFTVSADDGETWSDLAETNLSDMTECNAAVVYHADRRIYEIFAMSRHPLVDGYGSLYQAWATEDSFKRGRFFDVFRHHIPLRGTGSTFTGRDIGYPAAVKHTDGRVFLSYYGGESLTTAGSSAGSTAIAEWIGVPPEKFSETDDDRLVNSLSGVKHVRYRTSPRSKDPYMLIDRLGGAKHPGVDVAEVPSRGLGMYWFATGNFVTIYEETSRANITANSNIGGADPYLIDVPTSLGNLYHGHIGAYILEVTWAPQGTASTVSVDLGNGDTLVKILRNYPSIVSRDSAIITAPCYASNDADDSKLKMIVSQGISAGNADFTYLRIKVIGYMARNE